jgi:TetR/AcrR family transcriptional regulator, transcriptional repressor for nem operon
MAEMHDTRQRLLDTAQRLFHARSYVDVGVQEICRGAGVKKGSFYHFFPSKRDLTLAMLDESWKQFRETVLPAAFAPDIAPLKRLERLLDMEYRHHKAVKDQTGQVLGCPYGNLAGEMSTQDDVIRERVARIFRDLEAPIEAVLREASDAGELAKLDCRATASAMVAYLEGLTLLAKTQNDPEVVRQLGPAMLRLAVPVREG